HSRYGRPGFVDVLRSVRKAWLESREELDRGAAALSDHVASHLAATPDPGTVTESIGLAELAVRIAGLIDPVHGGLKGAPKFPNFPFMQLLWTGALETGSESAAQAVIDSHRK